MTKMSKKEIEYLNRIFVFVERELLGYDENQHMQKEAVLRIKGIANGKPVASNKTQNNGNYSYALIYGTFLYCKDKIKRAIRGKEFSSEGTKVAYIAAIVRNNINTVKQIAKKRKKAQEKAEQVDTTIMEHNTAKYKSSQSKRTNKYDDMW